MLDQFFLKILISMSANYNTLTFCPYIDLINIQSGHHDTNTCIEKEMLIPYKQWRNMLPCCECHCFIYTRDSVINAVFFHPYFNCTRIIRVVQSCALLNNTLT